MSFSKELGGFYYERLSAEAKEVIEKLLEELRKGSVPVVRCAQQLDSSEEQDEDKSAR